MYVKAFGTSKEIDKRNRFYSIFDPVEIPKDYSFPSEETLERIERLMIFNINLSKKDEDDFVKLNKIITECPNLNSIYLCNVSIQSKEFFKHLNSKSLKYLTFYNCFKRDMPEIINLLSNYILDIKIGEEILEKFKNCRETFDINIFAYKNFHTDIQEELINSVKTPKLNNIKSLNNRGRTFLEKDEDLFDIGMVFLSMGHDSSIFNYIPTDILFKIPTGADFHIFLKK